MKRSVYIHTLLLFTLFLNAACHMAQPATKKPNKTREDAKEATNEGIALLMEGKYDDAEKKFYSVIKKYPEYNADAWQALGECYAETGQYKKAINAYLTFKNTTEDYADVDFRIAVQYYNMLNIDSSRYYFNSYIQYPKASVKRKKDANIYLSKLDEVKYLVTHPVPFKPVNLGAGVNTQYDEYFPGLSIDEKTLIFTRMINRNEDFYKSKTTDSVWQTAEFLTGVNTPTNEGFVSVSADGRTIFYTACNRPDGQGSCDIYLSTLSPANAWGQAINLRRPINTESWESQPSISADGLTLYFSSARAGGYGGADIWKTTWDNNAKRFGIPVNLGPSVNTAGEEQSPFIHPDGTTLYYSSTGHTGIGDADLFMSKLVKQDSFGKAINLGYPINTVGNERSIIIDRSGRYGYMSADRAGGMGGMDIYRFAIPKEIKPDPVSYVEGVVFDEKTKEKIQADVELIDLETGEVISKVQSSKTTGEFMVILKSNHNYAFNVNHPDYTFYSDNFELKQTTKMEPLRLQIPLKKPEAGTKLVLKNIFFETDKYDLKPESKIELMKLVALMKKFPNMKIEIGGHTDNTGNKDKNVILSNNRAKAVKDFLVSNNIAHYRITFKGYGDSQPIGDNGTTEGRALNRRTEYTIISN